MQVVADLHAHSKYARAVSQQMTPVVISEWARIKGIDVVGTGDFTHPLWIKELETQLEEVAGGLYRLKFETNSKGPYFLLSTEVAAIYSQGGKQRRIHLLIFAPNFEAVKKINTELTHLRMNLFSDGRPILGMTARDVVKVAIDADERCLVIPAHCWTPWFSLYGSMSGFDSIQECFGELSKYIYGIETGLSSDPAMNWRIPDLDNRAILSFSDAHSAPKLGREATVFELPKVSYENIRRAIMGGDGISYTIEFYPEEGKYHYTGHRNCGVRQTPEETQKYGVICPKCNRPLTIGVMHRVQELARQLPTTNYQLLTTGDNGVKWIENSGDTRPKYAMLVPLLEILAEALESTTSSQKVINEYKKLTGEFENEFNVLLRTKPEELERISGPKIREGVVKVRVGDIVIDPGYDGEFGKVKIWPHSAQAPRGENEKTEKVEQVGLF